MTDERKSSSLKEDEIASQRLTEGTFSTEEKSVNISYSSNELLHHVLSEMQDMRASMDSRLTSMELQLSKVVQSCSNISSRLNDIEKKQNLLVGSQQTMNCSISSNAGEDTDGQESGKLFLFPSTKESDYPGGSWLGDVNMQNNRVRCALQPAKLFHINTTCLTAMKMALTLIDHLFTQEELATSNISGRSNKGKKQLSPVLVFGIKCHLEYKFLINQKDWSKICQSIDAKCRFMWKKRNISLANKRNEKRKVRSSDLCVKSRDRNISSTHSTTEAINFDFAHLTHSNIDFNSCVKVITESPCELRIVNATPSQIAQLQESQGIILAQEMLPDNNDEKSILIDDSPDMSMNTVVMGTDLKGEEMEVQSSKDEHIHDIGRINEEASLIIHEHLDLEVELDSRDE